MADNKPTVDVRIDTKRIKSRIEQNASRTQKVLDAQVLKDSNAYCPQDTSMLQKSGILHTVIGSGLIIWKTPYARMQYYHCPNKSHDKNPNASMKWFKVAKSKRMELWSKIIHGEFSRNNH